MSDRGEERVADEIWYLHEKQGYGEDRLRAEPHTNELFIKDQNEWYRVTVETCDASEIAPEMEQLS